MRDNGPPPKRVRHIPHTVTSSPDRPGSMRDSDPHGARHEAKGKLTRYPEDYHSRRKPRSISRVAGSPFKTRAMETMVPTVPRELMLARGTAKLG